MRKEKIVISAPYCGWSSISAPGFVRGFNWNTGFLNKLLKAAEEYTDGRDTKIVFNDGNHKECEIVLRQGTAAVIKSAGSDAKSAVSIDTNIPCGQALNDMLSCVLSHENAWNENWANHDNMMLVLNECKKAQKELQ